MFEISDLFQREVLLFFGFSYIFSFFRKYSLVSFFELLLNIWFVYFIFFKKQALSVYPLFFLLLVSLLVFYLSKANSIRWAAFLIPGLILILARVLPSVEMADLALFGGSLAPWIVAHSGLMSTVPMVGLSYLVFRWYRFLLDSKLVVSSVSHFLLYCFFVPIFYIGPITSYREFFKSINGSYRRTWRVYAIAFLRIIWGTFKLYPLASLFFQMTFSRFLMNNPESISLTQFFLGCVSYPAYLFLNFSGFIDIVIGFSAFLGFNISKNFDRPYLASSISDFWRRWHVSLTELLKDIIHIPVLKSLERLGLKSDFLKYSTGVFLVFFVMAYWHGNTVNFYMFSAIQCVALIIQRARRAQSGQFTLFAQPILQRLMLWIYLAFSFFFFENNWAQIQVIWGKLYI